MGNGGLPEITDRFANNAGREIKNGSLEGTVPGNGNATLCMENGYRITIHGQILGENNMPLTQVFRRGNRSPFAVITIYKKAAELKLVPTQKDLKIDNLMEQYFGPYIEGYSEMKNNRDTNKTYIVVPKDGNWSDMSLKNLRYAVKEEYDLEGTKKCLLISLLKYFGNKKSDDELAKLLKVSRSWVNRIRTELKEKGSVGNDKLNNLIISNKTYEVYEALLACDGLKSNLDIAKQLRPKADFTVKKTKESLTDKVSRVRRQLSDAKLIKEYNTYKKTVNIADVRERLEKALISNRGVKIGKRKTHKQIADVFGLDEQQVANYSSQMKKKEKKEEKMVSPCETKRASA